MPSSGCSIAASTRWRDGYGALVRGLSRAWVPVLVFYVCLLVFAGWFVQRLPTGFIPALDRAIVIISLQLPPGASLGRTDAVVQQATDIVLKTPGREDTPTPSRAVNGATFTGATNAGLLFLVLDDFEERHQMGQSIDKIAAELRGKLAQIQEAQSLVFIPPPVRGMGAAAGFSMRLQDTAGHGLADSRASRRSSSPKPTARPASPTSSRPSRPRRRRSSSTSIATRRRC